MSAGVLLVPTSPDSGSKCIPYLISGKSSKPTNQPNKQTNNPASHPISPPAVHSCVCAHLCLFVAPHTPPFICISDLPLSQSCWSHSWWSRLAKRRTSPCTISMDSIRTEFSLFGERSIQYFHRPVIDVLRFLGTGFKHHSYNFHTASTTHITRQGTSSDQLWLDMTKFSSVVFLILWMVKAFEICSG